MIILIFLIFVFNKIFIIFNNLTMIIDIWKYYGKLTTIRSGYLGVAVMVCYFIAEGREYYSKEYGTEE